MSDSKRNPDTKNEDLSVVLMPSQLSRRAHDGHNSGHSGWFDSIKAGEVIAVSD